MVIIVRNINNKQEAQKRKERKKKYEKSKKERTNWSFGATTTTGCSAGFAAMSEV